MEKRRNIRFSLILVGVSFILPQMSILSSQSWASEKLSAFKQWATENKQKATAAIIGVLALAGLGGYFGYKKFVVVPKVTQILTEEYDKHQEKKLNELNEIKIQDPDFFNQLSENIKVGDVVLEVKTEEVIKPVQNIPEIQQEVGISTENAEEIIESEKKEINVSIMPFKKPTATFLELHEWSKLEATDKDNALNRNNYVQLGTKKLRYYNFIFGTKGSADNILNKNHKTHASTIILLSKDMKTFLFDNKDNVRNTAQKLAETELKKNIYSSNQNIAYSVSFVLMDYEDKQTIEKSLNFIETFFNNKNYQNTQLTLMIAGKQHSAENIKDILTKLGSMSVSKDRNDANFVLKQLHTVYLSYKCINGFIGAKAKAWEVGGYLKGLVVTKVPSRLDNFFNNLSESILFYNWYAYDDRVTLLHEKYFENYIRERYSRNVFFSNVGLLPIEIGEDVWKFNHPKQGYSERLLVDLFFGRMRSLLIHAELFEQNQDYCFIEEKNKEGDVQKAYFIEDIFLPRGAQLTLQNQLAKKTKILLSEDATIKDRFTNDVEKYTFEILKDKTETSTGGLKKIIMFEILPTTQVSTYIINSLQYMVPSSKRLKNTKELIQNYVKKDVKIIQEETQETKE